MIHETYPRLSLQRANTLCNCMAIGFPLKVGVFRVFIILSGGISPGKIKKAGMLKKVPF